MSVTENSICPPSSALCLGMTRSSMWRRDVGSDALSMASAAFFSRFISTCSMRMGSTMQLRQALRDIGVDGHVAAPQLDAGQLDRVLDDVRRVGGLALRLAALHEVADAVNDLAGALRPAWPSWSSAAINVILVDRCRCARG